VAQGWGERNVQLEPAGSAKRRLKIGPADMEVRRRQREHGSELCREGQSKARVELQNLPQANPEASTNLTPTY